MDLFGNRYYLCNRNNTISGFTCQEFNSFSDADNLKPQNGQPTTILYYSKLTPKIFDKFRLQRDISNLVCKVQIADINQ